MYLTSFFLSVSVNTFFSILVRGNAQKVSRGTRLISGIDWCTSNESCFTTVVRFRRFCITENPGNPPPPPHPPPRLTHTNLTKPNLPPPPYRVRARPTPFPPIQT